MSAITAAVWVVQIVNAAHHYSFNRFGLRPRTVGGLWGTLTAPVLHTSYGHMLSDTVPLLAIGWVLLLSGVRSWLLVTAVVLPLGGVLAWALAPSGSWVGSSELVFGWMGYLIARAYFSRRIRWIVVAVVVLFFFGTLLGGLVPGSEKGGASWAVNACGFAAGIAAGAALHPGRRRRAAVRPGPQDAQQA
jgi:membrane associated rhomboid family serine protease